MIFLRKFNDKYDRILLMINESFLLILCLKLSTNINGSPLKIENKGFNEILAFLFEYAFLPILLLEVGFVTYNNIRDIAK